jgi:hypothetical protein
MDEDPQSGRPSMSTDDVHIDAVHDLILQNHRLNQSGVLHHDNAPAHSSLVHNFVVKNETTVVPQTTLLSKFGSSRLFFVS